MQWNVFKSASCYHSVWCRACSGLVVLSLTGCFRTYCLYHTYMVLRWAPGWFVLISAILSMYYCYTWLRWGVGWSPAPGWWPIHVGSDSPPIDSSTNYLTKDPQWPLSCPPPACATLFHRSELPVSQIFSLHYTYFRNTSQYCVSNTYFRNKLPYCVSNTYFRNTLQYCVSNMAVSMTPPGHPPVTVAMEKMHCGQLLWKSLCTATQLYLKSMECKAWSDRYPPGEMSISQLSQKKTVELAKLFLRILIQQLFWLFKTEQGCLYILSLVHGRQELWI